MRQWMCGLVAVVWAACALTASAQESIWKNTRAKLASTDGYSVTCDYAGPEGSYQFHYVVQGDGDKILTEVLAGSARGAGAKVLYDPASDKDNVKLKTDLFSVRRSLTARDIKGSLLHEPLFKQLLEQLIEPQPREVTQVGEHTLFLFGEKGQVQDILEVDGDGNPVNVRRLEKGQETRRMSFRDLSWGSTAIVWP
jgi:hypothetical protein